MARIVRLTATGPVKFEPRDKPISICACGLSKTFPLCDGAHKTTSKLEQPGRLYEYDPVTLAVLRDEPDPLSREIADQSKYESGEPPRPIT
jgi:CDGSH-type Zn-finger protein